MRFILLLWGICLVMLSWGQERKMFLVAGQSNAVGIGDSSLSTVCEEGTAFEYQTNIDDLVHLVDPVGYNWVEEPFSSAFTGSIWPGFGKRYHELSGDTVIIVQAAKGGTGCHRDAGPEEINWSPVGILFLGAETKGKKAMESLDLPISGVIWNQGETDAIAIANKIITGEQYRRALVDLIQRFRLSFGCDLPFYIVKNGRFTSGYDEFFDLVGEVESLVAESDPFTFMVYERTPEFFELGWMLEDKIHYSQEGLNDIGKVSAENIFALNEVMLELESTPCPPYHSYLNPIKIRVFPNPAAGSFTLEIGGAAWLETEIEMFDASGREIRRWNFAGREENAIHQLIDIGEAPKGIILLRIQTGDHEVLEKVLNW